MTFPGRKQIVLTIVLALCSVNAEPNRHPFLTNSHDTVLNKKSLLWDLRGGARATKAAKKKNVKIQQATLAQAAAPHHEEELMSVPTAVANVLADLCPHGMLPIGT